MLTDTEEQGAVDIRELCSTMVIHMKMSIDQKIAAFFEIMNNQTIQELHDGGFILKHNLIKIIDDALQFLK